MRNRVSEKWEVLGTFKTGVELTNMLEQINQLAHINVLLICVLWCPAVAPVHKSCCSCLHCLCVCWFTRKMHTWSQENFSLHFWSFKLKWKMIHGKSPRLCLWHADPLCSSGRAEGEEKKGLRAVAVIQGTQKILICGRTLLLGCSFRRVP